MLLKSPIEITPRLLPGLRVGGAFVSIEYSILPPSDEGRIRYCYHIDLPDGTEHTGCDLQSGCQGGSLQGGLASLLGFLSACGESVAYGQREEEPGENANLYPPVIGEWCAKNFCELSMLEDWIQKTPGLIGE